VLTVCWAVKGGSGTSTVSALLALSAQRPVTLVDLDGDLAAILGVAHGDRPGVADWAASGTPADHLDDLLTDVTTGVALLAHGARRRRAGPALGDDERRRALLTWCLARANQPGHEVIIDAGTGPLAGELHDAADRAVLVTRNCYLALQRAAGIVRRPSTVVLIREAAVGLDRGDVERSIGAPVGAVLGVEPAIARAVNAGLLAARTRTLSLSTDGRPSARLRRRASTVGPRPGNDAA